MKTIESARKALNPSNRKNTLREFDVLQLTHYHNINNAKIVGLFQKGDTSKWPFTLKFISKTDSNVTYTYTMGRHLAGAILDIVEQEPIACFHPLNSSATGGGQKTGKKIKQFTALNKELYNAINIVIISKKIKEPDGLFFTLLSELRAHPDHDRYTSKIVRFNNALNPKKWGNQPMGVQDLLSQLRLEGLDLKPYSFPLIEKILNEKGKVSFLGVTPPETLLIKPEAKPTTTSKFFTPPGN